MGNCENLLKNYSIDEVFDLSTASIAEIDGFAELTAEVIFYGLLSIKSQYEVLVSGGFDLEKTILIADEDTSSNPFYSKKIVFTGTMNQPRSDLEKQAKSLGIKVSKSVSSKTDFLIIGENVGHSKMNKAKNNGVEILSESEYLKKLNI
jgi:DNA ligase (NAD+)